MHEITVIMVGLPEELNSNAFFLFPLFFLSHTHTEFRGRGTDSAHCQ